MVSGTQESVNVRKIRIFNIQPSIAKAAVLGTKAVVDATWGPPCINVMQGGIVPFLVGESVSTRMVSTRP